MADKNLGKIKVLHIITRLDRGGSSENILLTVLGLDKERYDITLVSGSSLNPSLLLNKVKTANIKLLEIRYLIRKISLSNDLIALFKLYFIINKGKFHIVHTHTSKAGVLGRIAAWMNKVPIIIHTPHGHLFYGYYNWLLTRCIIIIETMMTYFTDMLIALTHFEEEDYINYRVASKDKIISIYSGIEIEKIKDKLINKIAKKRELGLSQDCLIVGCVARLDYVKGHRYLLEAIPTVKENIQNAKFLLVGGGPLKNNLERQVKINGILDNVIFLDDREDAQEIISTLDLLVLSSLNEGMGRVLLEAQALGVPVVATKIGGIPEIVIDGKTGLLIEPKRSDILAEAIINILQDNPRREKMRLDAQEWVDAKFSAKTMIGEIDSLYQRFIKEKLFDAKIYQ